MAQIEMFPDVCARALKTVIGLDLSLRSTGIVVIDRDKSARGYTIGYAIEKATREQKISRWLDIAEAILNVIEKHRVESVAMEHYAFGNLWRGSLLAELGAVVSSQIYLKTGIAPTLITPKTVRSYLLGDGASDKEEVRKFCESRGYKLANNDEYDACAIALMMWDFENVDRDAMSKTQVTRLSKLVPIVNQKKKGKRGVKGD